MRRRVARIVRTLKRNPTIRRVFGKHPLAPGSDEVLRFPRVPDVEVPAGNVNPPAPSARAGPVVLFVALGLDGCALSRFVERVVLAQTSMSFAPLFVVDCSDFEELRRHSYLFEYVPIRNEWIERSGRHDWDAYLSERLRTLVVDYDPDTVLTVGSDPDHHDGSSLATLINGLVEHRATT